ncbi:MAG: hypothetical protein IJM63_06820 [Solobacterium sp.]|nr:hypothetical protein [Solobacterium sp.]
MTEKQIKTYRIVYISVAALFLIIFMMTGRFLYMLFTTVCLSIAVNPEMMKRPKE